MFKETLEDAQAGVPFFIALTMMLFEGIRRLQSIMKSLEHN